MNRAVLFAAFGLAISSAGLAKEKAPPPPQPSVEPDWAQVRKESEASLRSILFDPNSAEIHWTHGFRWGWYKPILQRKVWGWVGCGSVNAKNRMGGYVGASAFVVVYDGGVRYRAIDDNELPMIANGCAKGGFPPIQAAFQDLPPANTGPTSIADELAKLAALRDKGIITPAEFDAQKAKLLGN